MEHKTCQERVLWELEQAENKVEELTQKKDMWFESYLEEFNRAENLREELDRAVEQLAELERQMEHMADKYNELARQGASFEPVKEGNDGN